MKKNFLILSFYIISTCISGQDLVYFENFYNDSIHFYFDEYGEICTKSNAQFYRTTEIDPYNLTLKGKTTDYKLDGSKAYQCEYSNGQLNGKVFSYYKDGNIMYQGYFKNSLRDSTWKFYYQSGSLEKIILYQLDQAYMKEFYKKDGTAIFSDGNGKYKGQIQINIQPFKYKISGKIIDGKQDGKWKISSMTKSNPMYWNVKFSNGQLLEPINFNTSFTGYILHENINLFKFVANANNLSNTINFSQMIKYKGSNNLTKSFIPDISNKIEQICKETKIDNFLCLIQFVLNKENKIENLDCYSTNNDIVNPLKNFISNIKEFETLKPGDIPIDCAIYFPILYQNKRIIIPEFSFNNSAIINVMDFIPEN